ncbi:hypothetical protein QTP86_015541, partial [Hemibagrus guttatus]
MPEPPQLPPFDVEEQRLYSELLPGDRAPYLISKGAARHPTEEAHFGHLYPGSYPFGHDPELMTIGEDSFELHSVDLELEAVEKQIRDLQVKQAQLRQRKAALESSRTDAHLSQVNSRHETITPTTSTPCASLPRPSARTRPAQVSFTPAPGYHAAWMQQQRKTRARPRARTSPPPPPPVFKIPTQNRFAPLRKTACDAVIIGDSIVRHVRATAAKGKVHTRCLPGARVLDVSAQVPAILKKNIGAVVLHAGTNDIRLRQTEILKKDFRSLVELVRTTSPTTRIIVSGPLPTFQRGIESLPETKSAMREVMERSELYEYLLSLSSGFGQTHFQ